MTVLEVVSLISLVFWAILAADRRRSWPSDRTLASSVEVSDDEPPDQVVALVPARNEAEILPLTLPSLLHQKRGLSRIVLIDDGSEDGTRAIAERLAAQSGSAANRLEVIAAGACPKGWSGKVHAQHVGYSHLKRLCSVTGRDLPEWLLLTDADIRHRADSLPALLQKASSAPGEGPFDMVSVMARLRAGSPWERLVVPAFVFFFQLLYPFRRVGDPRSRVAAAAGGCVLIRTAQLEEAGGFEAVAEAVIDDVALGRAVKRSGGRIWLGLDSEIESVRPYRRLADLWQMVSRTAFTQLGHRWELLVLALVALALFVVSPPFVVGWGLLKLCLISGNGSDSVLRAILWAALAWTLMSLALFPSVRHHRVSAIYSLSLPLTAALFGLMTLSSAWDHLTGKGGSWRGRRYAS